MADFGLALEEGVKPASKIVPGNSVDDVAEGEGYPEGEPGDECETHAGADTDTEADAEADDLASYKEGGDAHNCGQRMSPHTQNDARLVGVEGTLEAAGGTETCSGRAAAAVDKKFD